MNNSDWHWALQQTIERLRTRYDHIGRKSGAPFLGLVYPPEVEAAVMRAWRIEAEVLKPDIDVLTVDALEVTAKILTTMGAADVVDQIRHPWAGSNPVSELGDAWASAVARETRSVLAQRPVDKPGRPAVIVQRLAALYPASGPRDVMQQLWDVMEPGPDAPVIVLIPGQATGPKAYKFLGKRDELMYRGDLV